MALFSKRNIDKAKAMAEKNKDKIASSVSKATDFIDDKTGGKHSDKLKKVDDAAAKYSGAGGSVDSSDSNETAGDGGDSREATGES